MLRIGLGLQLVVLAVHNKLYEPAATYFFLSEYPYYNFPQYLGWTEFTHLHFALAAGVFEAAFGIMLVLGLATRYVLLVVSFFFVSTGIISGFEEVMGHLPIFGVIAVLFVAAARTEPRLELMGASRSAYRASHMRTALQRFTTSDRKISEHPKSWLRDMVSPNQSAAKVAVQTGSTIMITAACEGVVIPCA